jgi:AcrR family transcriptional regulator
MSKARGLATRSQGAQKARPRLRPVTDKGTREARGAPIEDSSRQRISAVALALFGRYGYDGVSLQMIADEVGLHKSSLFHHYRGKSELMDEVAEGVVARLLELLDPLLSEEQPSLETLYSAIERMVDHFSDSPGAARLLVTIMTSPDDSEVRMLASSERSIGFYAGISRWLERARKAGVVRDLSIRQAIPNLMGLILFYPAVANDLRDLLGADAFSPRARQIRKAELLRIARAMFAVTARG